jgi:hypothetical protein
MRASRSLQWCLTSYRVESRVHAIFRKFHWHFYSGYREGGIPGALAGGVAGFVVPELLTSPTSQMVAARGLNSPVTHQIVRPLVQGGALTLAAKRAQAGCVATFRRSG